MWRNQMDFQKKKSILKLGNIEAEWNSVNIKYQSAFIFFRPFFYTTARKMFTNWWTNTAQRCLHLSTKVLTRNVRRGNRVMSGKLFRPITSFVSNLKLKRCTTEFLHDKFSQTIAPAMVFIHNFVFRIKRSVM